jgi:hypothetical protein
MVRLKGAGGKMCLTIIGIAEKVKLVTTGGSDTTKGMGRSCSCPYLCGIGAADAQALEPAAD